MPGPLHGSCFLLRTLCHSHRSRIIHFFIRIISCFIALFIIVNGILVIQVQPFGDESLAYVIVAVGIIIPILVQYVAQLDKKHEDCERSTCQKW